MTSLEPITSTLHEPRHAAAFDFHRNAAAIKAAKGYQPRHAANDTRCPRCTAVGASGLLCDPCAGEVATALRNPDDELTAVYYPAHSPALDTYRPDVRLGGIA